MLKLPTWIPVAMPVSLALRFPVVLDGPQIAMPHLCCAQELSATRAQETWRHAALRTRALRLHSQVALYPTTRTVMDVLRD